MKREVAFCLLGIALCTPVFADNPANAPAIPTLTSPTQIPGQIAPDQSKENYRGNPLDQGGETCATATPITALPYCDNGTTAGYINDYAPPATCSSPHSAPDVVYSMTPPVNAVISVSLCGSTYNTVLHIWRGCPGAGGVLVCCNDDFCSVQSCCQNITVAANTTYYIIVDGNGGAAGNYSLSVALGQQCPQPCPPDTCPYPDQDIDPINNSCTANNVQIGCDTSCGLINPTDDLDFYNFTVPAGGPCLRLTIDVFADDTPGWFPFGQGLDPIVTLIAADCATSLAEDDNGGTGNDARLISPCLPPGQYRILVRTSPLFASVGPYILAVACDPCPCEPDTCPYRDEDIGFNNVCADANPTIGCPDTVCGEINPVDDGDYYEFRIPTGSCARVRIDVFGNDTPGWWPFGQGFNSAVCLYDINCSMTILCDENSGVGEDAHLVSPCLPAGLYELRVHDDINNTTGPYILAINCLPCQCPPDTCPYPDLDQPFEPGNNFCTPQCPVIIHCEDTLCGRINPPDDVDWYCLQMNVTPCGIMTIDVFGDDTPGWFPFGLGLDPKVSIYTPDCGTLIATDDNSGVGNDARLVSPCLPPGFYAIKVEGIPPTMGPYILAVHCEPCQCPDTCTVVCPGGGVPEGEPCPNVPDFFNAGCNTDPPTFRPVNCNQTICGTSWADGGARDEDWFGLQIDEPDTFFWCVEAEFPFEIAIFTPGPGLDPCDDLDTLDCARGDSCEAPVCVGACMQPGFYMLYIAPTVFDGVDCRDYVARLLCTICGPRPCPEPDSVVIHYPTIASDDIHLYWPPVPEADEYRIYRSNNSELPPSPATYLATTVDTHYVDTAIIGGAAIRNFYKVVAHCPAPGCDAAAAPAAIHKERERMSEH